MEADAAANADGAMNRVKTLPTNVGYWGLNRTPRRHCAIDANALFFDFTGNQMRTLVPAAGLGTYPISGSMSQGNDVG
jgi:hypothetical protein